MFPTYPLQDCNKLPKPSIKDVFAKHPSTPNTYLIEKSHKNVFYPNENFYTGITWLENLVAVHLHCHEELALWR